MRVLFRSCLPLGIVVTLKIILGDAKSSLRDNCLPERERKRQTDREEKKREEKMKRGRSKERSKITMNTARNEMRITESH